MALKTWYEAVSNTILPAIRAIVAEILVKQYGYTQTAAARLLGVTQPAISNYLLNKRGNRGVRALKSDPKAMAIIEKIARYLVLKDLGSVADALDLLLSYIRGNKELMKQILGKQYYEILGVETGK
jgi:predicted transcriptional regulator